MESCDNLILVPIFQPNILDDPPRAKIYSVSTFTFTCIYWWEISLQLYLYHYYYYYCYVRSRRISNMYRVKQGVGSCHGCIVGWIETFFLLRVIRPLNDVLRPHLNLDLRKTIPARSLHWLRLRSIIPTGPRGSICFQSVVFSGLVVHRLSELRNEPSEAKQIWNASEM